MQAYRAIAALSAITTAQQDQLAAMRERLDAMREMILALEHTQENPIVVDEESCVCASCYTLANHPRTVPKF